MNMVAPLTPDSGQMTREAALQLATTLAFDNLVGGKMEKGVDLLSVIDPSSDEIFVEIGQASLDQLERAVLGARRAQPGWFALGYAGRRAILAEIAALLRANVDRLAGLLTLEQGKPFAAARDEIVRSAASIEAIAALEIQPALLTEDANKRLELRHKPMGVVAAISPWNAPIILGMNKVATALHSGNAVILKVSPYTPLTSLEIGRLIQQSLPAGIVSILAGGDALGQALVAHRGIDKISFTGSVRAGKHIMASAAERLKRVTLELGGNDPAIVLGDVDPAIIGPRLFHAAFLNAGQICQAIKRLYVHRSVYADICEVVAAAARAAKVDEGFAPGAVMGPVQNRPQFERVKEVLNSAQRDGGSRIIAGGYALDRPGYFVAPTVVADAREGTRVVDEETFGPVLPIIPFDDVEDAVDRANDSRLGLGASVWTNDLEAGAAIADRLEAGVSWVNHHLGVPSEYPFGGVKESGMGRVGSDLGLKENLEPHLLWISKTKV